MFAECNLHNDSNELVFLDIFNEKLKDERDLAKTYFESVYAQRYKLTNDRFAEPTVTAMHEMEYDIKKYIQFST